MCLLFVEGTLLHGTYVSGLLENWVFLSIGHSTHTHTHSDVMVESTTINVFYASHATAQTHKCEVIGLIPTSVPLFLVYMYVSDMLTFLDNVLV